MDLHDTVVRDVDELNVASVGLKRGADLVENRLDLFLHVVSFLEHLTRCHT